VKKLRNHPITSSVLALLLSSSLITGCQALQAQEKVTQKETIAFGEGSGELINQGQRRTYYIYTPKSYNPSRPMPMVLVFHGDNGTGHSIADVTQFNNLAEQKGFIAVYPDGIKQRWTLRANPLVKVNDVEFTEALIDHIQQVRNIDSRKIYASGFSRGAILTQALACQLSDKIAAFASVAGSLPVRLKDKCQPNNAVSILMINGTNDTAVHYEGDEKTARGALLSIPDTVNHWRSQDKCTSPAQIKQLPGLNKNDKYYVKTTHYSNCRGEAEVLLADVMKGGHFWPGGASQDPNQIKFNDAIGYNASASIWNFFSRHSLP
jgi:polyhydroxybutyrate depolymerase